MSAGGPLQRWAFGSEPGRSPRPSSLTSTDHTGAAIRGPCQEGRRHRLAGIEGREHTHHTAAGAAPLALASDVPRRILAEGAVAQYAAEPARPQALMDLDPEEDDDGFPIVLART